MGDVSQLTPAGAEPAARAAAAGQAGARRFFGRLVREQPLGTAGGIAILLLVLVSIFADGLAPYRFEEIHLRDRLQAPSAQYLLGTDHVGRDLLSRLIHGARLSLTVGLTATALTVVVAVLIGGTTGFIGGRLDLVTQRFVDAWMAFPGLLLLLTIMSIAGRGMAQIIIVLGVSGGIPASRVVRGAVLGVKENVYFRWWRTVALPYIESGDWPCVPTCHAYSTRPIPDATSRSQRDRRSCGARITGAGVGSATKSCRVAVSREPRFDGAADPSVCRRRSSARGGGNGVCHEPSRQILGGVNEHESDV